MATIKDIAQAVGVSMMTVSRAFNKPDLVKETVREAILKKAQELDYKPNHAARSLVKRKTGIIKLVSPMSHDAYYFSTLFTGIADALSKEGYAIMMDQKGGASFQCDGLIYMGLEKPADQAFIARQEKPFVLFGKSDFDIDWVDIDNRAAMAEITNYLLAKGHKHIGYLGRQTKEPYSMERYDSFRQTMLAHGLKLEEEDVFFIDPKDQERVSLKIMASLKKTLTAFVCGEDFIAYHLIQKLQEQGYDVPGDISVTGFDGLLYQQLSTPKIVSMKQPVYYIGQRLAEVMIERLKNPLGPKIGQLIPLEYVKGKSVRAL